MPLEMVKNHAIYADFVETERIGMPRTKRSAELPALYFYVGSRIRQAREAAEISQEGLAQKVGLQRTSIVNFEAGKQRIPLEDIYRFAGVLDLTVADLLPEVSDRVLLTTAQAFAEFLKGEGAK